MIHFDFTLILFCEIKINFYGNVLPVCFLHFFTIDMHAFIIEISKELNYFLLYASHLFFIIWQYFFNNPF